MTDLPLDAARPAARPAIHRPLTAFIAVVAAGILAAELLALYFLYHPERFVFECRAYAPGLFCGLLSAGVMRGAAVAGALLLYLFARPGTLAALRASARPGWGWGALQIAGFAAILAPQAFLAEGAAPSLFWIGAALWTMGALATIPGTLFFVVPPAGWRTAARTAGPALWALLAAAFLLPDIAPWIRDQVQYLWQYEPVTEITFHATAALLMLTGEEVTTNLTGPHIGVADFVVGVGRQCSGVEGFVLITGFLTLYFWLFRDRLRFPRVFLLLPLGLFLSWCLNVVRIAALIWIGAFHSPDLAIEGFHSHAGWLMFTILSVGFAALAHQIAWFRKAAPAGPAPVQQVAAPMAPLPFFRDPVAARIFPFLVFMASALLASTFSQTPALLYPLRALAMAAAILAFWPILREIRWRPDPLAVGTGLTLGVLWLATAPAAGAGDTALAAALAALPPALFALWVITRILGTALLVPVIEELFFRGYVLARIDRGGKGYAGLAWRLAALAVSAALFAALHDRLLAAGLAGLIFGLLYLRQDRIADAIWAHAAANAVIAGWAVAQGDWSVI